MSDRADDKTGYCFPSVADLIERTELNRKTVLSCLSELERRKFLVDTGQRTGKTKQVKIWKLDFSLICAASRKESQKWNGSNISDEQSHISLKTVPKTGHGTTKESASKLPTTISDEQPTIGVVVECELDEIVEAALWQYSREGLVVRKPARFKSAVRRRIIAEGASVADLEARDQFIRAKAAKDADAARNAEECKPRPPLKQEQKARALAVCRGEGWRK
jgi:DNA-binding transcriptional regulator YhcF (GntR family)